MLFTSVIIPTLNRCETLKNAIASAQQQAWPADQYEIVVVDNGCVDGTRDYVERLAKDSKTSISLIHEPRLGLHHARHAGIRASRGDILIFTDDDATFAPDWIGAYAEAFARHPEMLAAGGPVRPVWEAPPPQWLLDYMGDAKTFGILSLMEPYQEFRVDQTGSFFGVNMAIRRSVFDWGAFHPELFGTRTLGDGETGLNRDIVRKGGLIGYIPTSLVYHHIPAHRMTIEYIRKWAGHLGGAEMYERWWNRKRSLSALAREGIIVLRQYWRQWIADCLVRGRRDPWAIEKQFQSSVGWCKLKYIWWMLTDPQVQTMLDERDLRP
jgi:glycosyltransferase involved in cell wall biosynthesis